MQGKKKPKSSSRQIKAFLISEGKQAGPHPGSPPSVTDPIHPNHNSLPFFIAGSCCSYTNKCQWHLLACSFNPWLRGLQLSLVVSVPSIKHHEGSEAARLESSFVSLDYVSVESVLKLLPTTVKTVPF